MIEESRASYEGGAFRSSLQRPRVIHLAHTAESYGIGTLLESLVREESERGMADVSVAFQAEGPQLHRYTNLDVETHCLSFPTARNPKIFTRLRTLFRRFDIVVQHSWSPWAFMAAKAARARVIYMFHGTSPRGTIAKAYMRRVFARRCDHITCASQSSARLLAQRTGVDLATCAYSVFPYGRRLESVQPTVDRSEVRARLGLSDRFVVGSAMRLAPEKRPHLLIQAMAALGSERPITLALVGGEVNSDYSQHCRDLVCRHGLGDRVLFLGYRADVIDLVNAFDVFVLPTRDETFGLALVEAMALGVPSIVFQDGGGTVEVIGDTGTVVEDVASLVAAIQLLYDDTGLRAKQAAETRARAQLFDIRNTAASLFDVYSKVLVRSR